MILALLSLNDHVVKFNCSTRQLLQRHRYLVVRQPAAQAPEDRRVHQPAADGRGKLRRPRGDRDAGAARAVRRLDGDEAQQQRQRLGRPPLDGPQQGGTRSMATFRF